MSTHYKRSSRSKSGPDYGGGAEQQTMGKHLPKMSEIVMLQLLTLEKIAPKTLDGLVRVECKGMFSFSLLNF